MNKIKIAFITISKEQLSGGQTMAMSILSNIDTNQFRIESIQQFHSSFTEITLENNIPYKILSLNRNIINSKRLRKLTFIMKFIKTFYLMYSSRKYANYIISQCHDIVWCENLSALFLTRKLRKTNILIVYNMWSNVKSKFAIKYIKKNADFVIVESNYQISKFSTFENKEMIYTQIPFDIINSIKRARKSKKIDILHNLVVGFMGGYKKSKGFLEFIELAYSITVEESEKNISFLVAGASSNDLNLVTEDIKRKIRFLGNRIRIYDWMEKIDFYEKIDIFISLSKSEGLPGAIREAVLIGIPVIATNVGGTSDIIPESSFLIDEVDSNKIVAIAKKSLIVYNINPAEYNDITEKYRIRAENLFLGNNWIKKLEIVFKKLSKRKTNSNGCK